MVQSYKDLIVWQKSFNLAIGVYRLMDELPKSELFGLVSQMQRCAVSIPSNIAEGHQRNNIKEYRQFIGIAKGSAAELETQLLLVKEIFHVDVEMHLQVVVEVQKMLSVLSKRLKPKP
jgi:four helix bundle protein